METKIKLKTVQHYHDLWSVQSKTFHQVYMHSSFAVTEGAYFYEVELVTGGKIEVGWVTRLAVLDRKSGFENNGQSIVLQSNFSSPGDIIGCFVNTEKKLALFYYNGKQINVSIDEDFFYFTPIFASASLPPNHQIIVNFGHKSFKYLPPNEHNHFETFHSVTLKNDQFFQLKEFSNLIKWHCIKKKFHLFVYSQKTLTEPILFGDLKQKIIDQVVLKIYEMLSENENWQNVVDNFSKMFNKLKVKMKHVRFIQSAIEVDNYKIFECKNSVLAFTMSLIYKKFQDKIAYHHFHAIILHYFDVLQIQSNDDVIKIRNLCIILAHYRFYAGLGMCCNYVSQKSAEFLINVLKNSNDYWSQLYSLIALTKDYNIRKNYKQLKMSFLCDNNLQNFIDFWKNKFNADDEIENIKNISKFTVQLQLNLCANIYYNLNLNYDQSLPQENTVSADDKLLIQMSSHDKNKNIKLSFSNLMIRNDEPSFVSIRSKFSINLGTFYFEVIIFTAEKIRIGLAAKQIDISKTCIGDDKFSIGIDGYSKYVIMNKKVYTFKDTSLPRWKVGDVIGIYTDFYKQTIIFGINNKIIELNGDPFEEEFIFSSLPCHVAASLGTFQQCFFNFTFKSIPPMFLTESTKLGETVNINNSVFLYHSKNRMNNFSGSIFNNKKLKLILHLFFNFSRRTFKPNNFLSAQCSM